MDVTFHPGPAPLLAAAGVYLRHERFSASVLAVVASRVADSEAIGEPDAALWATVRDDGEVVADYWRFHLDHERRRVHDARYDEGVIPLAA